MQALKIAFKPTDGDLALEFLSKYIEQSQCKTKREIINAINNMIGASIFTLHILESKENEILH